MSEKLATLKEKVNIKPSHIYIARLIFFGAVTLLGSIFIIGAIALAGAANITDEAWLHGLLLNFGTEVCGGVLVFILLTLLWTWWDKPEIGATTVATTAKKSADAINTIGAALQEIPDGLFYNVILATAPGPLGRLLILSIKFAISQITGEDQKDVSMSDLAQIWENFSDTEKSTFIETVAEKLGQLQDDDLENMKIQMKLLNRQMDVLSKQLAQQENRPYDGND